MVTNIFLTNLRWSWTSEGRGREKSPLDFEIWHFPIKRSAKKFFLSFKWVKWNFAIFLLVSLLAPHWKKCFRRPWRWFRHCVFLRNKTVHMWNCL